LCASVVRVDVRMAPDACLLPSHATPLAEDTLLRRAQAAAEAALRDGQMRVALSYFNDLGSLLMDRGRYIP